MDHWKPAPSQPQNVTLEGAWVPHTVPSPPGVDPCSLPCSHQLYHLDPPHPMSSLYRPVLRSVASGSQPSSLHAPVTILVGPPSLWMIFLSVGMSSFPETFPLLHLRGRLTCPPTKVVSHQCLKFRHPHIQYSLLSFKRTYLFTLMTTSPAPSLEVQHTALSFPPSINSDPSSLPWLFHLVSTIHYFSNFLDKTLYSFPLCPSTLSMSCSSLFSLCLHSELHQSDKQFSASTHSPISTAVFTFFL